MELVDREPSPSREQAIRLASTQSFDLLVIGGGITGAGIALDAQSRGLRTLLLEKGDFASGTSSKSTKLIHGGLRYLKNLEMGLVREVGEERQIVHQNAPHLVRPDKMLIPVIKGGSYGLMALGTALWTYDRLAGVRVEERRIMLDASEAAALEPLLQTEGLQGAGLYTEYTTDDARLTLAVIRKAEELGAICLNYTCVTEFNYAQEGNRLTGARWVDTLSGAMHNTTSHVVVNAAGPWVDQLKAKDQPLENGNIVHSKGVHIVVRASDFPIRNALYFDVGDGRMVFAIPVRSVVYIGTTDTPFHKGLDDLHILQEEVKYLLDAVNRMFPSVNLHASQIISGWAGVRPLVAERGKSVGEISRKDEVFVSPSGLVTIAGGKLTGYRKMAEKVTNLVVERLQEDRKFSGSTKCVTANIHLKGGDLAAPLEQLPALMRSISQMHGLEEADAWWLVKRFGSEAQAVARLLTTGQLSSGERILMAALEFGLRCEHVQHPADFLVRRSGLLYYEPWRIPPILDRVLARMGEVLAWDAAKQDAMAAEWRAIWEENQALSELAL